MTRTLVALSLASVIAAGADWPGWRGAKRDGISPDTGLAKQWGEKCPKLAWQAQGLGSGYSSVSMVGDRIYTMGDRADGQYVLALNRKDGKTLWATKVGPVWEDDELAEIHVPGLQRTRDVGLEIQ